MNCKPGDLAVVVRTATEVAELRGKIMKRHAPISDGTGWEWGRPAWEFEGAPLITRTGFQVDVTDDSCLRPIRDPGDDARDETLDWLPVPKREEPDVWTPKRQVENA
jgi:hypothetical protein